MPAFARPMIAMKRPIPTATAFLRLSGIDLMIASRIPQRERRIKIIPSTRTAVKASCQVQPIPLTTVNVKKALRPIPGANATGRLAINAITNVATAAETAVAVNTALGFIPVKPSMPGFTAKI